MLLPSRGHSFEVEPLGRSADRDPMGRLLAVPALALALALPVASASASPRAASWAAPQIATVVDAGLMGTSAEDFRPDEAITWSELSIVVASLGGAIAVTDPYRPVTIRELDAQLVTLAGLRQTAKGVRAAAFTAGLMPTAWLGTETVARMLGLRINHERTSEALELQLKQPATRAEAAYSIARLLTISEDEVEAVESTAAGFSVPELSELQRSVLSRALKFVGSPYVWAGTSEKPQRLFGKVLPGGFDCSGFVWRVYKLEPFVEAEGLGEVLKGRTTYAMSGEVSKSERITRAQLAPGDLVFFGSRGTRSKPSEVGHMGIYVGNGWLVHSSRFGTTLAPMTGWYETGFAWGRRPIAEAGLASSRASGSGGARDIKVTA
jgi:cell wall-associated NlpC family hydrolase